MFVNLYWNKKTIILKQDDNSLTSYKLRNVSNTIRTNLVTIDNDCSPITNPTPRLVRNDGVLPPDEHKSRTFATIWPPCSLPHLDFNKYSSHILPYHQISNIFSNPITSLSSINVITVPLKIWRKKPVNEYTPIIYDDVDEDLYVFKSFGKIMKRSSHFTPHPRSDLILWDKSVDEPEVLREPPPSATRLPISSKTIIILSAREVSRKRCLTSSLHRHRLFTTTLLPITSLRLPRK